MKKKGRPLEGQRRPLTIAERLAVGLSLGAEVSCENDIITLHLFGNPVHGSRDAWEKFDKLELFWSRGESSKKGKRK